MVYFMQAVAGGAIKIGHSADVDRRRVELETIYGTPLAVLATMDGGREEEQTIHARFSHLRLGRTEQFQPGPDLMEFIGRPLLIDQNPGSVEAMPSRLKPVVLQVRGSEDFKAWFDELGRLEGLLPNDLFTRAIRQYAKEVGFPKPAPVR